MFQHPGITVHIHPNHPLNIDLKPLIRSPLPGEKSLCLPKVAMRKKFVEVLRLRLEADLSVRQIEYLYQGQCRLHPETPQKCPGARPYLALTCTELDDGRLAALFYPQADTTISARHVCARLALCPSGAQAQGVSKQLLWESTQRYPNSCYSYSQFCDRYKSLSVSCKSAPCAGSQGGEKLFIDYCGPTVPIVSPTAGEVRQAQVFVAVLGASSYTFAEATWSQSLPDWLQKPCPLPLRFSAGHRYC